MRYSWRYAISVLAATTVFCVVCVVWIDRPLALYLASSKPVEITQFFRYVTMIGKAEYFCILAVFFGLLFWIIHRLGDRNSSFPLAVVHTTVFLLLCEIVTSALIHTMKMVIGRPRPRFLFNYDIYDFLPFSGYDSFPSGHTQAIVAGFLPIALCWPALRFPAFFIIAMVALSRVVLTKHYLSDVIAAVVVTALCVLWMRDWFLSRGWLCAPPGFRQYPMDGKTLRCSFEGVHRR